MQRIDSMRNPRVKAAVRLRKPSERRRTGRTLVEGYRELLRAAESGWPVETLFVCPPLFLGANEAGLIERCRSMGAELVECAEPVFRKMSYRDRPDGLLAAAPLVRCGLDDLSLPPEPVLLVVEQIEKPGNLGTILRSADAAGVDGVIVCDGKTDLNNPNVIRASVGTLFYLPVAEAGIEETLAWLSAKRIDLISAVPDAERSYFKCDMAGSVALAVGAEQYGLTEAMQEASRELVSIPMCGRNDSLNVASAAVLMMYEALRQRSSGPFS